MLFSGSDPFQIEGLNFLFLFLPMWNSNISPIHQPIVLLVHLRWLNDGGYLAAWSAQFHLITTSIISVRILKFSNPYPWLKFKMLLPLEERRHGETTSRFSTPRQAGERFLILKDYHLLCWSFWCPYNFIAQYFLNASVMFKFCLVVLSLN